MRVEVNQYAWNRAVSAWRCCDSCVDCVFIRSIDKQANGAAAAVTDVFTSANLASAMHNLSNSQRFVVLKKMKFTMGPMAGATTAYNNSTRTFEMFKKCNIPLEFSSTTGAITELRSNNVFLLAGTDQLSDDLISVAGTCRVRFSDGSKFPKFREIERIN